MVRVVVEGRGARAETRVRVDASEVADPASVTRFARARVQVPEAAQEVRSVVLQEVRPRVMMVCPGTFV